MINPKWTPEGKLTVDEAIDFLDNALELSDLSLGRRRLYEGMKRLLILCRDYLKETEGIKNEGD